MCTSPAILYTDGSVNLKTGKFIYHYRSFNLDFIKKIKYYQNDFKLSGYNCFLVPCGHCVDCRLHYRKEWSIRLLNELEMSDNAYFLTITYNDFNLPDSGSLHKDDLIRFMKSLYKAIERYYKEKNIKDYKKFKYFACGEYGDGSHSPDNITRFRPHYHAVVYNVPFNDFTEFFPNGEKLIRKKSSNGKYLLYSDTLEKLWNKGFVQCGEVNYHSCSYVAGYVQKKLYGDDTKLYLDNFLMPPFLICSKGLGLSYFNANKKKLILTDQVFYSKDGVVCSSSLPRYYLKLLEKDDVIDFAYLKHLRNKKDTSIEELSKMFPVDIVRYFKNKEMNNNKKVKRLIRR